MLPFPPLLILNAIVMTFVLSKDRERMYSLASALKAAWNRNQFLEPGKKGETTRR